MVSFSELFLSLLAGSLWLLNTRITKGSGLRKFLIKFYIGDGCIKDINLGEDSGSKVLINSVVLEILFPAPSTAKTKHW